MAVDRAPASSEKVPGLRREKSNASEAARGSGAPASPETSKQPESRPDIPAPATTAVAPKPGPGVLRSLLSAPGRKLAKLRVDFQEFTPSERAYIVGQALFIYLASLPLLIKALTGSAAATGVARVVHYWIFGSVSLVTGDVVRRNAVISVLKNTIMARGLISGPGSLAFELLGVHAPMEAVTLALTGVSIVTLIGLRWIGDQVYRVHHSPEGMEAAAYENLNENLRALDLPLPQTRFIKGPDDPNRPTVALLAPASMHKLAIAMEGGRRSPGDVHLALDPSWLVQELQPDGTNRLLLKKGFYFDAEGQPVLAEYEHPRLVRYFGNFYTMGANDRDDGVPLEHNLDTPMSNSVQLEKITNDKLITRLLLAAKGISIPATLAFLMAAHPLTSEAARSAIPAEAMRAVTLASMPPKAADQRAQARREIERFLELYPGPEVVVKPSGPNFHSARGVAFFKRGQIEEMVDHVLALSTDPLMPSDGAVLIDERIRPPPLYLRHDADGGLFEILKFRKIPMRILDAAERPKATPRETKDWNLRLLVARAPWNGAETTAILPRAGMWGLPTNTAPPDPANSASFMRFEDVLAVLRRQHGLLATEEEADQFERELDDLGRKAMLALMENEARRVRENGEPLQAQTDMIGLDVMVYLENGRLVPKIIEVNDHDSGGQPQFDSLYPGSAGRHSRVWVATMLARARRDAMKGKRLVIVGAGYKGKRFFFDKAKALGIKVVLIDRPDSWARDFVSEFIPVDMTEPEEAIAAARLKLLKSARKNGKIGGITTFWEDDVILTAKLAREMGLPYHSVEAARTARNKFATREAMRKAGLAVPSHYYLVKNKRDFENALAEIGRLGGMNPSPWPMVLKPARGAEAMSVVKIETAEQARTAFDKTAREIAASSDPVFAEGREIVFESYIDGMEWDVDLVMQHGRAVYASITDNWPTQEPYFLATGASLPSRRLSPKAQQESIDFATRAALALGFTDGVFHIEGKYSGRTGQNLLEVNARPGGVYVVPWNEEVWGVDLAEMLYAGALGAPIIPYKSPEPRTHLEGEFLIPDHPGVLEAVDDADELPSLPGYKEYREMIPVGREVLPPPSGYDRVGMVVAEGKDAAEARERLKRLMSKVRLRIR